ncbi:hypothetical protein OAA46_01265 [bacterium]|nr:hypothetical protein [bacterium]
MNTLNDYQEAVKRYSSMRGGLPDTLRISTAPGGLSTWYAPFEHINREARIVLCGITPGLNQADTALATARDALARGESVETAQLQAKATGSFAGVMRTNLAAMLDYVKVNRVLEIDSCSELFGLRADLVHHTSALRYPVLKDGENYSGDSRMIRNPYLWDQILEGISEETCALPDALWIPLGPDVAAVFERLIELNVVKAERCLLGLPHASGANAERIKYFLGEKPRELLSSRTNAQLIENRRRNLQEKVEALIGQGGVENCLEVVCKEDVSTFEPEPEGVEPRCKEKNPIIMARVTRGKNQGKILQPHRHPSAQNRYVVTKTRFEKDYIYLDTLAEIPAYLKRGYGLRMSIPDSDVAPSKIIPSSITVE